MKRINFLLLALFFISVSCSESKFKNEENALGEFINFQEFAKTKKCILIIPMNGCGNYTPKIIEFSKKSYFEKRLSIILTGINGQNIISIKELKDYQKYFIFDEYSELISLGVIENKPVVFFLKENSINEKVIFDDSNVDSVIKRIKKI